MKFCFSFVYNRIILTETNINYYSEFGAGCMFVPFYARLRNLRKITQNYAKLRKITQNYAKNMAESNFRILKKRMLAA